jgi:peptidoglycan/LPS O-acetylase OafA/YrhL
VSSSAASSTERPYLGYVHSLRGLAITFVVMLHVADALNWGRSSPWPERLLIALLANASVPFMFVSGFLFQHLSDGFIYHHYLRRRFRYVVLPYLIISIPALVAQYVRHCGVYGGGGAQHPLLATLSAYTTGAHMLIPLWYMPVIIAFYLAAPVFFAIDRRPKWYWLIVPTLLLAVLLHRPKGHLRTWQSTLYFLPVYWIGMWSSHHREAILGWVQRLRWWLLGIATTGFVVAVVLGRAGPIFSSTPFSMEGGMLLDMDLPLKLLLTLLLLEWLRRRDVVVHGLFGWLADISFGVFFLHEYVIDGLRLVAVRTHVMPAHPGLVLFASATSFVLAACWLGVRALQRLFGKRSRLLIGS